MSFRIIAININSECVRILIQTLLQALYVYMSTHLQCSYMYYLAAIITVKELEFLNAHQYVSAKIHHGLAKVFRRGMSVSSVSSYPILKMYSLDVCINFK